MTELSRLQKAQKVLELKKKKAELQRLLTNSVEEKERNEKVVRAYELKNRLEFFNKEGKGYLGKNGKWEYNPLQRELHDAFITGMYRIFTYTGANRIGKTFLEVIIAMTICEGKFPWEPEEKRGWIWELYNWRQEDIKVRIVGQDWEKHIKTVLVPELKKFIPDSVKYKVRKNSMGVEAYYEFESTGATLEIMSNNSDSGLFEGWNGVAVLYDEPPKRDIRVACVRGLVDNGGIEGFFMTLLKEAWIDKEVINLTDEHGAPDKTVKNVNGGSEVNIGYGITQENVDQFAKYLTEEERDARINGRPSYLSNLILDIDKEVHIIDSSPKDIPTDWLIDISIDYHPAKPQYIHFLGTDNYGRKFLCHTVKGHGDGNWIGDQIIKAIDRYSLRVNRIIADPLSKTGHENKKIGGIKTEYDKIAEYLYPFGYELESAGSLKQCKDDGIIAINELLMTKNNIPALYIFRKQSETMKVNTIEQLVNWMWDDKGNPSKEDDDSCENLYRLVLLDTKWRPPESMIYNNIEQSYSKNNETSRNLTTGY